MTYISVREQTGRGNLRQEQESQPRGTAFLGFDAVATVIREWPEEPLVAGDHDGHKFVDHTQHIRAEGDRHDEDE